MICKHCGKELRDGAAFCNFCGKPLNAASSGAFSSPSPFAKTSNVATAASNNEFVKKVFGYIDKIGAARLATSLSAVSLLFLVLMRLFGLLIPILLISLFCGGLIYLSYRKERKLPLGALIWSGAFLVIGLILYFTSYFYFSR